MQVECIFLSVLLGVLFQDRWFIAVQMIIGFKVACVLNCSGRKYSKIIISTVLKSPPAVLCCPSVDNSVLMRVCYNSNVVYKNCTSNDYFGTGHLKKYTKFLKKVTAKMRKMKLSLRKIRNQVWEKFSNTLRHKGRKWCSNLFESELMCCTWKVII